MKLTIAPTRLMLGILLTIFIMVSLFLAGCSSSCSNPGTSGCESPALAKGLQAWAEKDVTGARMFFAQAVADCPENSDTNFFYGFILGADAVLGDGSAGDPSLGADIMAGFGVTDWQPFEFFTSMYNQFFSVWTLKAAGRQDRANEFPVPLPAGSPTGGDAQAWLYEKMLPQLVAALQNFEKVDEDFVVEWVWPQTGETIISDYGDLLGFQFTYEFLIAWFYIQQAYNINFNIAEVWNDQHPFDWVTTNYPDLFSLSQSYQENLAQAKEYMPLFCNHAIAAIEWIAENRPAGQMGIFNLTDWTEDDIEAHIKGLNEIIQSLSQATVITGLIPDNQGGWYNTNTDLGAFFNGIDIQNPSLLPTGSSYPGDYPDPTFGGVFPNELQLRDRDELGESIIPDVLK